ncbi:oxygen-insensitive NADPH nitroreductase [Companilactobacillus furfuricola]|uniref:oxygen-insensitive NADPH nitroreductase n=1 Tax=Companilactobacillus furfuricola TaxID=1462575 RepID=UPI000F7B92A1|nr:oxygen-insensitive NADPH nitroreductase [Companilactobacillus furfuricola]
MDPIIEQMRRHTSVRDFKDEPLNDEVKKELLLAAQSGSSSNFVQAYSIIEIADKKLRKTIADITNSAPYVKQTGVFYVFVADLYRQATMLENKGLSIDGIKTMEQLLVATVDTTIAAENMAVAAESLGLGICYIGGIRNEIRQIAQLLQLPKYTFPLFGMTIGIPNSKNQVKPRMPLANQVAVDRYDTKQMTDLNQYDQRVRDYYLSRNSNPQDNSWTDKNIDFFKEIRRPDVGPFLRDQGFSLS